MDNFNNSQKIRSIDVDSKTVCFYSRFTAIKLKLNAKLVKLIMRDPLFSTLNLALYPWTDRSPFC